MFTNKRNIWNQYCRKGMKNSLFQDNEKNGVLENYHLVKILENTICFLFFFICFFYLSWYFVKVFFLRHSPLTENMRRGSDINKNIETAMVARSPYNFSLLPHALNGKLVFKERSGFRLDHSKIGQTQKYQCFLCSASWFSPYWAQWDVVRILLPF